jgi:hypothetical protein
MSTLAHFADSSQTSVESDKCHCRHAAPPLRHHKRLVPVEVLSRPALLPSAGTYAKIARSSFPKVFFRSAINLRKLPNTSTSGAGNWRSAQNLASDTFLALRFATYPACEIRVLLRHVFVCVQVANVKDRIPVSFVSIEFGVLTIHFRSRQFALFKG